MAKLKQFLMVMVIYHLSDELSDENSNFLNAMNIIVRDDQLTAVKIISAENEEDRASFFVGGYEAYEVTNLNFSAGAIDITDASELHKQSNREISFTGLIGHEIVENYVSQKGQKAGEIVSFIRAYGLALDAQESITGFDNISITRRSDITKKTTVDFRFSNDNGQGNKHFKVKVKNGNPISVKK